MLYPSVVYGQASSRRHQEASLVYQDFIKVGLNGRKAIGDWGGAEAGVAINRDSAESPQFLTATVLTLSSESPIVAM